MINNETRPCGYMGDASTPAPAWLTNPADIAKWATLSDKDQSDWARAHGSAVASSQAAAAAEAAGMAQQQAQASAMERASQYAADVASYRATVQPWYKKKGVLLAGAGAGALVLFLAFRKPARGPVTFHKRAKKKHS